MIRDFATLNLAGCFSKTGVPNLSLTMYPFSILTDVHVSLKFLMTKMLSKIAKIHRVFNRSVRFLESRLRFYVSKLVYLTISV